MLDWIAEVVGASGAHRIGTLQSLWSGYGELFRVALDGGRAETAVVKFVARTRLPRSAAIAR